MLENILKKGVKLAINNGHLIIEQELDSDQQKWFDEHKEKIIQVIVKKLKMNVFIYENYSTGNYGKHKYSGVTLNFTNLLTGESAYIIFNIYLKRMRTTNYGKKGTPLPKGHFSVGKKQSFYKFWQKTKLEIPRRLSSFHDYMGKMKGLLFMFEIKEKEKLDKNSMALLSIDHEKLKRLFISDSFPTTHGQVSDNSQTKNSDKLIQLPYRNNGTQANQTTSKTNYGLSKQGSTDTRESISSVITPISPTNQTIEQWLDDYSK